MFKKIKEVIKTIKDVDINLSDVKESMTVLFERFIEADHNIKRILSEQISTNKEMDNLHERINGLSDDLEIYVNATERHIFELENKNKKYEEELNKVNNNLAEIKRELARKTAHHVSVKPMPTKKLDLPDKTQRINLTETEIKID